MNLGIQTPVYRIRGTPTGQPGISQISSTFLDTVRQDSLPHYHEWRNVFKKRNQEEMLISDSRALNCTFNEQSNCPTTHTARARIPRTIY